MKSSKRIKNNTQLLILISIITAISLTVFGVFRLINGEFTQAYIDFFIAAVCIASAVISHLQQSTHIARWILLCTGSVSLLALVSMRGTDVLYWIYPIIVGGYYLLLPRQTFWFNMAIITAATLLTTRFINWIDTLAICMTMIVANLFAYAFSQRNHMQQEELKKLAHYDSLTGIRNRRSFDRNLKEISEAKQGAAMIVIDIDFFKKINDNHGHTAGDSVLKEVGQVIENNIRVSDLLFRYGGEEFILLTRDNAGLAPEKLAEKIRVIVSEHTFSNNIRLTISCGVATLEQDESIEHWFRRADNLLYEAKDTGRNKVVSDVENRQEGLVGA